jgi:hypothetical protein
MFGIKIDASRLAIPMIKKEDVNHIKNSTPNAADDLLTTIEDYFSKRDARQGLSANIFKEMTTNQVASTKGKHFGLGFEIYDLGNNE